MQSTLKNNIEIQYKAPKGNGADLNEANNNTLYLIQELKKKGVECESDNGEYLEELTGLSSQINAKIKTLEGSYIYVGFDRYGYCEDMLFAFDQASFDFTLNKVLSIFSK